MSDPSTTMTPYQLLDLFETDQYAAVQFADTWLDNRPANATCDMYHAAMTVILTQTMVGTCRTCTWPLLSDHEDDNGIHDTCATMTISVTTSNSQPSTEPDFDEDEDGDYGNPYLDSEDDFNPFEPIHHGRRQLIDA